MRSGWSAGTVIVLIARLAAARASSYRWVLSPAGAVIVAVSPGYCWLMSAGSSLVGFPDAPYPSECFLTQAEHGFNRLLVRYH
ncbi:hypothetical protein GCM10009742_80070 [Kribbella karoonensis]|uniref:Secreted protein n=1 Tax=Kribbella karoonensis TaxID=324851 RepID=A0ABP4QP83_9ACTN